MQHCTWSREPLLYITWYNQVVKINKHLKLGVIALIITLLTGLIQVNNHCSCSDSQVITVGNSGIPLQYVSHYFKRQVCNCPTILNLENSPKPNYIARSENFILDFLFYFGLLYFISHFYKKRAK